MSALKWLAARAASVLLIGVLPAWLLWAGSYSSSRDVTGIVLWTALVLYVLRRIRKTPAERSVAGTIKAGFRMRVIFIWLVGGWVTLSALDRIFQEPPVRRSGNVVAPAGMRTDLAGKRISLALSGGGYRAALLHAGVIMELSEQGVPITNIGSVSGGSIIGSFVASGGDPTDFAEAVGAGRFRLKRELTSAFALPRWLFPFGSYSRRDVQAAMLRRVLLPAEPSSRGGPDLIVATTDLAHVSSVGVMRDGYLFAGPTTSRFLRKDLAISMEDLGDLADIVAISGAFPGAFPPKRVSARFTRDPVEITTSSDVAELDLILTDGGVRDNLGLKVLEAAHDHALGFSSTSSTWQGFQPGRHWAQDLILVSDGGAAMQPGSHISGPLAEVMRAIDVASLETGVVRLMDMKRSPPKRVLALPTLVTPYPDSILVLRSNPASAQRYFFFRPGYFSDATLNRIVELVPNGGLAREALADYRKAGGHSLIDITNADALCGSAKLTDSTSATCAWWRLVNAVGQDIELAAGTFIAADTLRDDYSREEVDALVRLGRYLVLIEWPRLEGCLDAVGRDAPDMLVVCAR